MTRNRVLLLASLVATILVSVSVYAATQTQSFGNGLYVRSTGLTGGIQQQLAQRIAFSEPMALSSGNGANFDCRGMRFLTIIAGSGATVTYSQVDAPTTVSHDSATDATTTEAAGISVDVKWPFYYVSTASGAARVACVP